MLSKKTKVVSSVLGSTIGALLLSSSLAAEVKFSGTGELDLFYRTNQIKGGSEDNFRGAANQEIAIVANVDGKHEGASILKEINWRLATKVATDGRYDRLGLREAWIGGTTDFGEFRFGNQFSNVYLIQDGIYGGGGAGNIWADFGAHSVQYGRGVSYFSPNLAGFTLSAQYDLGGKAADDVNPEKVITSYATEVLLTYDSEYVRFDAGYHRGVNSGTMGSEADAFGGTRDSQGSGYAKAENKAQEIYVGTVLKYDTMKLNLGFSNNHWSGEVLGGNYDKVDVNKFLARGEYGFMDKHSVSLGYQKVFDAKMDDGTGSETVGNGMNVYNFQYNYMLTDNISTFLQARHHTFSKEFGASVRPVGTVDGYAAGADSVTRVLVGAFMTF